MALPSRDLVERVKAAADIVDVAQSLLKVPLTRKGERYVALCPFHREKTPSFSLHAGRQIFHCFGCGKGGDVLTLVMELERLTFPEALRLLADRVGVDLPDDRRAGGAGPRLRLMELLAEAARFYAGELAGARGTAARAYLQRRGLSAATIERFAIGYAPDEWRGLHAHLRRKGFEDGEILAAGLVRSKDGNTPYDLLRDRVVIPIRDARGRVIAFGGRVLDASEPKYLNTPETDLFSKRTVLFGFDVAREAAQARGAFIVVEGYMDVIAAHQAGAAHVVGTLGTALTPEHARAMARHARRVVLLFDGDAGGVRAADRGTPLLVQAELDVAVVTLPDGLDPDEFLAERGLDAFEDYVLRHGEDPLLFLIRRAREKHGADTTAGAVKAMREVLAVAETVDDELVFQLFLHRIAEAFGVDEAAVRREARRDARRVPAESAEPTLAAPAGRPAPSARRPKGADLDEIYVLIGVLADPELARRALDALSADDFRDPGRRVLFQTLIGLRDDDLSLALPVLRERLGEATGVLDALLARDVPEGESAEQALERLLARRVQAAYEYMRREASRSGLLRSDDDETLSQRLADARNYHESRTRRSKDVRGLSDPAAAGGDP